MQATKIVHLHLLTPLADGRTDLYFGSLKAIYDAVPPDAVGIKYKSLTTVLHGREVYENKKCVIRVAHIQRAAQSVNKKSKD